MSSAVADLEAGLQAMQNLKPPGVSASRIANLTGLCVSNIQSESVLIQKIYTHFKKTPGTHKLGVLYVVDSVTRKWLEQAKSQGQAVNSSAQDGTYAAGVHRVTELMPVLMNDIMQSAPAEQKEKIKKLIGIWEKSQTFPTSMLDGFKQKLNAPEPSNVSTTPPGSPPAALVNPVRNGSSAPTPAAAAAPVANSSSILEALASMARQNTTAPAASSGIPAPAASYNMPAANLPQPVSSSMPQPPAYPPVSQSVNMPSLPFSLSQLPGYNGQPAMPQSNPPPNPYAAAPPPAQSGALDPNTQQQILLIKALAEQGVPFDKIPALIQGMTGASGPPAPQPPAPQVSGQYPPAQQSWGAPSGQDDVRDRGYGSGMRSPGYRGRTRSRSPDRSWGARGSPRGRDRMDYGRNSPPRGRNDDRRGGDYRQRSPPGRRGRSPSPSGGFGNIPKWVDYDRSLPEGSIKVLSRTLFVGGVTCPEAELRQIFGRFGTVQTCIVNRDKRHAFVKMLTRRDAVAAKDGAQDLRSTDLQLRTRWGVGFGPRDCSDYASGVSIIPIQKLTEADRKWMLTAPYGGSGGRPIESGLCVEEPDIEIGAGVSSKAISRRMQTDKGGNNGPKSSRTGGRDDDGGRSWGRRGRDADDANSVQVGSGRAQKDAMGGMPSFPFGMGTLPNGMPNFPGGFSYPDANGGQ